MKWKKQKQKQKKPKKKRVFKFPEKSYHFWHRAATCSSQNHVTSGRLDMMMDTLCKNDRQRMILERRQKLHHTKIRTSAVTGIALKG